MNPVFLDTGAIVTMLDRNEQYHNRYLTAVQKLSAPLVTCEAVIAESCYLLRNTPGASDAVLQNVERSVFLIPFILSKSAASTRRIMKKYGNLPADYKDACLVQLATELGAGEILTLDRGFEIYRWGRGKPFRLLIPLD